MYWHDKISISIHYFSIVLQIVTVQWLKLLLLFIFPYTRERVKHTFCTRCKITEKLSFVSNFFKRKRMNQFRLVFENIFFIPNNIFMKRKKLEKMDNLGKTERSFCSFEFSMVVF